MYSPQDKEAFRAICKFFKWANPGTFLFIFVFSNTNFTEKNEDFSGIRTQIIGIEGKIADLLTSTTVHEWWQSHS